MAVRRILAVALSAPLLLLAGCGGGGSGSIADPPLSSAPSSSPTAQVRETPEHFIRRWAAEDTRMQNTGETSRFRSLSVGCRGCARLADRVDAIYAHGGFVRTGGWRIRHIEVASASPARSVVTLDVNAKPTVYRESRGGPRKSYPGGAATYQLSLRDSGHGWTVVSLGVLS